MANFFQRTMTLGDGTKIQYDIRNGKPQVKREDNGSYSIFGANGANITGARQGSNINVYSGRVSLGYTIGIL